MLLLDWLVNSWSRLMADAERQEKLKKAELEQKTLDRNLRIQSRNLQFLVNLVTDHGATLLELKTLGEQVDYFNARMYELASKHPHINKAHYHVFSASIKARLAEIKNSALQREEQF